MIGPVPLPSELNAQTADIARRLPASRRFTSTRERSAFRCCGRPRHQRLDQFRGLYTHGRTIQDKLTSLGTELVERFIKDTVNVARVTIAEADRFPELGRHLYEASRDRAASAVSQLLNDATHALSRSSKDPFSGKRSLAIAQIFMDIILLPMLMRSLMGDEAKVLRRQLPSFVRERVNFFLAACEAGWAQG